MKRPLKKLCLITGTALLLTTTACGVIPLGPLDGDQGGTQVTDSESILSAEGTWHLVEQEGAPTPLQQHMDARDDVNTGKFSKNNMFVNNAELAKKGETTHFRLLKMEREVAALRSDFNKLLPPLSNLIVADTQLDATISGIQKEQGKAAMVAKPVTMKSGSAHSQSPVTHSVSPAPTSGSGVTGVRFGQHPGKTRMVLDLGSPTTFTTDLDNNEKILLVDLKSASWNAASSRRLGSNPLIAGYSVQGNGSGGSMLVIELKRNARVVESAALKPRSNPARGHRIYVDIAAQ